MKYQHLWQRLTPLYNPREAQAIIRLILEEEFNLSFADILIGKVNELSQEQRLKLEELIHRIESFEPVQYVLGKETFLGRSFHVRSGVLIPRPETEVLVEWVKEDCCTTACNLLDSNNIKILDIGTGSGCIAITLSLDIPHSNVTAWDISKEALLIAKENASALKGKVNFRLQDVFNVNVSERKWNVIISNPPYICCKEHTSMSDNVLKHEPHIALFVPDDDPLRFYRAIANIGKSALTKGGSLYFETNPLYINDIKNMLEDIGYTMIQYRNDQFDKQRFIKATLFL